MVSDTDPLFLIYIYKKKTLKQTILERVFNLHFKNKIPTLLDKEQKYKNLPKKHFYLLFVPMAKLAGK